MTLGEELRPALTGATTQTSPGTPADVVFMALAIAARSTPEEGEPDPRSEEIATLVTAASPEVRTRALQLTASLIALLTRLRGLIIAVKMELQDADMTHGDAEVLPDGWLVVKMNEVEIGRVPYNPERGMQEAGRMAEDILSEHVKLHVNTSTEVLSVPIPDNAEDLPPRPDGVRARRLVVH